MSKQYFKSAAITPDQVLAGDSVEMTITLIVGEDFSADNSRIIFDMPAYLGTTRPNLMDQEDHGFVEVLCSNPNIFYEKKMWDIEILDFPTKENTSFRGMAQRMFVLELQGDADVGDEIKIKWGYVRNGFGVGTKVSTLVLTNPFINNIHVRYFEDGNKGLPDLARSFKGYERPLPDAEVPLSFQILPREPEYIRLIRKQKKVHLSILDRFYNVCPQSSLSEFINEDIESKQNEYGVFEINNPDLKVTSKSLPLYNTPDMTNVYKDNNIYFGDLHTHSSVSNDCIEREKMQITPDMMYAYGRQVAALDFMAITDHHQSWDIERNKIGRDNWEDILKAADSNTVDGEFLAFPGMEFRCKRGDTAVVFNEFVDYDLIDHPGIKDIRALWEYFKGKDYITIPHFHNIGGLKEQEWYHCPYEGIEPYLEIYSCHGSFESDQVLERHIPQGKGFRKDRHGKYFLRQGYQYGFGCNSDGHKGNPGSNGLTAVYSKELTKESIMDAIRKRHIYGTTNARIKLLFTINDQLMGSVIPNISNKEIFISLEGERPFKSVDILRNGELYERFIPADDYFETRFIIKDLEPSNWYVRATQVDHHIAYSSPIWFKGGNI